MLQVQVNGHDLAVKHYEGKRIITLPEVDQVHEKNGSARKNFSTHRERFIEGVDYFVVTAAEFRQQFNPNFTGKRGNPNIEVILLTESGYLLLTKSFYDDLAWEIQRSLVQSYFRGDQQPADNIYSVLRQMVGALESQDAKQKEQELLIAQQASAIDELREEIKLIKVGDPVLKLAAPENMYTPSQVASKLKLYSSSRGLPHAKLVNQIAYRLGFYREAHEPYQDQYVLIEQVYLNAELGQMVNVIRYTDLAVQEIRLWLENEGPKYYFEEFYKRNSVNGKVGDLRRKGYDLGHQFLLA